MLIGRKKKRTSGLGASGQPLPLHKLLNRNMVLHNLDAEEFLRTPYISISPCLEKTRIAMLISNILNRGMKIVK